VEKKFKRVINSVLIVGQKFRKELNMKVVILNKESEDLISEIKKKTLLEDEQIIFNALMCYNRNVDFALRELLEANELFWKYWGNIYERCAELKRLEKK